MPDHQGYASCGIFRLQYHLFQIRLPYCDTAPSTAFKHRGHNNYAKFLGKICVKFCCFRLQIHSLVKVINRFCLAEIKAVVKFLINYEGSSAAANLRALRAKFSRLAFISAELCCCMIPIFILLLFC